MSSATPAVKEEEYPLRLTVAVIVFLLTLAVFGVLGSRQVAAGTYLLYFPKGDDSWKLTDSYFCALGDSVNGTREVNTAQFNKIRSIDIDLTLGYNSASDFPLRFEVSLDGSPVGTFGIYGRENLNPPTKTITLASEFILTKSSLDIQYRLIDLGGGGGIIILAEGSTLTLIDGLAPKTKRALALEALSSLGNLRDSVYNSGIHQGPKKSLLSKLDRAIAKVDQALVYIDKGNEQKANKKLYIAKNSVVSFVKAVDIFSERIAPYDQAWHDDANGIIELIEEAIEAPL